MTTHESESDEPAHDTPIDLQSARRQQKVDAARGCLVALVLETAALLAGAGWLVARWLELFGFARALALAFFVFTGAALLIAAVLVVLGNLPANRRLRVAAGDQAAKQTAGESSRNLETSDVAARNGDSDEPNDRRGGGI